MTSLKTLFTGVVLSATAMAQTLPCVALNDTTTSSLTAVSFVNLNGSSNRRAWRYTPPSTVTVSAGTLYTTPSPTSTQANFMSLEIWSDDPVTGKPLARLVGTTWSLKNPPTGARWQGGNFDNTLTMTAGTTHWLCWIEPGGSFIAQQSTATATFTTNAATSTTAVGSIWAVSASLSAPKVRLYCNKLEGVTLLNIGDGCAGSLNTVGTLFAQTETQLGNTNFTLEGFGFVPNAPAILAIGFTPNFPAINIGTPGCNLYTDLGVIVEGFNTGVGDWRSTTFAGHVKYHIPLPLDPLLQGLYVTAQLAVIDVALPGVPLSMSNAVGLMIY